MRLSKSSQGQCKCLLLADFGQYEYVELDSVCDEKSFLLVFDVPREITSEDVKLGSLNEEDTVLPRIQTKNCWKDSY